jgi:hypothetical protein
MLPRNTVSLLKRFAHFFVTDNCGDHGLEHIDEISTRSKIGNVLSKSRLFAHHSDSKSILANFMPNP